MYQDFSKQSDPTSGRRNLAALRREMMKNNLTGFIVPRCDVYRGENVAPADERLKWLTGFTGSAGSAIALMDKAVIFIDGRYTIQVKQEVDTKNFTPVDITLQDIPTWMQKNLSVNDIIGYDSWLHSFAEITAMELAAKKTGARLVCVTQNLIDQAWLNRPSAPSGMVQIQPEKYAGTSAAEKLKMLAKAIYAQSADAAILTLPAGIAWAFNIRGSDIPRTPIVHAFALIFATGKHKIFISSKKLNTQSQSYLTNLAEIHTPDDLQKELQQLGQKSGKLLIDKTNSPIWLEQTITKAGGKVVWGADPTILPKACKNDVELECTRQAHIRDGKPMVQFLKWCDENLPSGQIDEITAAQKLEQFRRETKLLKDISFETISGAAQNGAICHYRVDEQSNIKIPNNRLYLNDSGGQYIDGTTDITRVVAVGDIDDEAKRNYTLVLKGMIALSITKFPVGTTGAQLDALARQFLWAEGKDYAHGTGHGVGAYLGVHEGPQGISPKSNIPLKAGMILSNEPGYYKENAYGIRIENLMIVCNDKRNDTEKSMHYFETITFVPIDKRAIEKSLLSPLEINWLNNYHKEVWLKLSPQLNKDEKAWLKQATSEI